MPLRYALALAVLATLPGCGEPGPATRTRPGSGADAGFAGVQRRGKVAMGVDQYTSRHVFEPLADGGRIELQRDTDDSTGTARIREHMALIKSHFAAGDFRLPGFVHARSVPGTAVMASHREAIAYEVESLPRGAALRVRTADPAAIRAVHEFLAFQRRDHRAAAHHDS